MNSSFQAKFWEWLQRLGELVWLNLCFLLCCLPLITVGPALAGLYAACFRFGTPREEGAVQTFFRSFRACLKQGILSWLAEAALIVFCCYCALVLYAGDGVFKYSYVSFLVLLGAVLITAGYLYPLIALFQNTWKATVKNAVILSFSYLPRSLCVALMNIFPVVLFLETPDLFLRCGIFWIFLYFSVSAYASTCLLRKVFLPFLPEDALPNQN